MSKGEPSLWDIAIQQNKESEEFNEEASILLLGSKGAGKTSIILRYLDRNEPPKPTVALEYTFGRRTKGANMAKDVGHIWELGGGTWLTKLIDIPINADNIRHISVVIVLDLSKPNELWFTLEKLLNAVKSRVDSAVAEAQANDIRVKDDLSSRAAERIGTEHPDRDLINPFLIPFTIIGAKYDIFQDFEPEKRKVICKTLRFVAHTHGANLLFFSDKQDALVNKARAMVSHHLFSTPGPKNTQFEHNKPIIIGCGSDSMEQIGSPMLSEGDIGRVTAKTPLDLWKQAYVSFFPQENVSDPALVDDPAKDPQFTESAVDAMRIQKDQELERYRRLSERKMKEAKQRTAKAY